MQAIQQWAFSICAAMVACGLAQMLLPPSNMEKVFRTTVSVFFLCCLLSPMLLRGSELRFELEEYTQADIEQRAARLTGEVDRQAGAAAGEDLKKIVEQKLAQMGINYLDIAININTNGQSAEDTARVDILLDTALEPEHDRIRSQLEELGMDIRLVYTDTGGGA